MTDQHPNFEPYERLPITAEDRRLLWEVVTMVDVDTLQDNLNRVGCAEEGKHLERELQRIGDYLDPDGKFLDEWNALKPDR